MEKRDLTVLVDVRVNAIRAEFLTVRWKFSEEVLGSEIMFHYIHLLLLSKAFLALVGD